MRFNLADWKNRYFNKEIIDIYKELSNSDIEVIKKLGISVKDKVYTEYEYDTLNENLLLYYEEEDSNISDEEKEYVKSLNGTGVSRTEYENLLNRLDEITEKYNV